MLILAVADIHGRMRLMDRMGRVIRKHRPDLLVVAGDLCRAFGGREILSRLDGFKIPVLMVRGNSDPCRFGKMIGPYPNLRCLDSNRMTLNGTDFAGLGGALAFPFHSRICLREKRRLSRLAPMIGKHSVLVVHPPPYGVLDEVAGRFHAGSRNLRRLVLKREPAVLICGHIHERRGIARLGNTVVVNCAVGKAGAGVLVDVEKGKKPKAELP